MPMQAVSTDTPGIPRNAISSVAALFSESSTIRTALPPVAVGILVIVLRGPR